MIWGRSEFELKGLKKILLIQKPVAFEQSFPAMPKMKDAKFLFYEQIFDDVFWSETITAILLIMFYFFVSV